MKDGGELGIGERDFRFSATGIGEVFYDLFAVMDCAVIGADGGVDCFSDFRCDFESVLHRF